MAHGAKSLKWGKKNGEMTPDRGRIFEIEICGHDRLCVYQYKNNTQWVEGGEGLACSHV